jgi:hypothetical protein
MQDRAKWAVLFVLLAANFFFLARSCRTSKRGISEETRVTFYVDSVWSKGPGEINTLQNDVIYFGRTTDGEVHTSKSRLSVGDSFVYVYRRVY